MRVSFFEVVRDAGAVVGCVSAAANFLPPAEKYNDYPRFKKFYETFVVNTVAWVALSIRAQYPSVGLEMLGFKQPAPSVIKSVQAGSLPSTGSVKAS